MMNHLVTQYVIYKTDQGNCMSEGLNYLDEQSLHPGSKDEVRGVH